MTTESRHAGTSGFIGRDQPPDAVISACVHCGLCLPTCPTYRLTYNEASSPRGRIHLIQAVADGRLSLDNDVFTWQMYECLNCRACEAVCPSGVLYGQLVEPARAQIEQHIPRRLPQRIFRNAIFGHLFGNMRLFRLFSALIMVYQRTGAQSVARRSGLLKLLRLNEQEQLLPAVDRHFVVPNNQRWLPPDGAVRHRVALFTGCVMSTAFANTDRATARVLAANGCEVIACAEQTCCGALAVHAGDPYHGREMAKRNIRAFERLDVEAIIVNAAGCGANMKEFGHLLHDEPAWHARARAFSARVKDVTEFLASIKLTPPTGHLPLRVTYQEPCHLVHAQRISREPRALLRMIPGLHLVEMEESSLCCGSAGIYNVTNPDMAQRLLDRKLDHALATAPDVIASANPGCIMQLRAGMRQRGVAVRVEHVIDLLDRAYGASE